METSMKRLCILAVALGLVVACSSEQDIGDAAKPPPAGTLAPGAPSPGPMQTPQ